MGLDYSYINQTKDVYLLRLLFKNITKVYVEKKEKRHLFEP
jgi:hypothetical protein